jgi:hypothetical protein
MKSIKPLLTILLLCILVIKVNAQNIILKVWPDLYLRWFNKILK